MFQLSPKTSSLFILRSLVYIQLLFIFAIVAVTDSAPDKQLTYVGWGQKCRLPKTNEQLKPREKCNEAVGIFCQVYTQGSFCGCRLDTQEVRSDYSYDARSGECRLKVGKYCHYVNATASPEIYERLAYNIKCHESAECKQIQSLTKPDKKLDDPVCQCRDGFFASQDLSQCLNPNSASAFAPTAITKIMTGLAPLLLLLLKVPF